jgi:hypothetical protein
MLCVGLFVLGACGSSNKSSSSPPTSTPTTRAATSTTSGASDPKYAEYIGLTVEAATAKAKAEGHPSRVIEKDGVSLPASLDYNPDRLNFTVNDNKVIKVATG